MLRTRVITAVVLFAAFLLALFFLPPLGWLLFVSAVATVAAWEWGGLMRLGRAARLVTGALLAVVCAAVALLAPAAVGLEAGFAEAAWRLGAGFYGPAAVFWLLVVPLWLQRRWPLANPVVSWVTGLLVLLPVWLALVQLRQAGPLGAQHPWRPVRVDAQAAGRNQGQQQRAARAWRRARPDRQPDLDAARGRASLAGLLRGQG
jgi:phosphatidate cytidylyltransferase